MIVNIAAHIAHRWVTSGVISKEDEGNYYYGLQLLLSTLFNLAIIIGLSIIFRAPLAWISFMLAFVPLRLTAGGFHAKTHWACIGSFCTAYACLLLLSIKLPYAAYGTASTIAACSSLVIIYFLSPVAANNKPLTMFQTSRFRRYSIVLTIIFMIPATLLLIGIPPHHFYIHFYAGEICGALSLVIAKITMNNCHL